ncbi:MAG TPA: esterase-like activity of phytase family protein [Opitutaceae bacterium]
MRIQLFATTAAVLASFAVPTIHAAATPAPQAAPEVTLTGFARLPADTFTEGPPSGQFESDGRKLAAPRFASQPVQGVSSIKPGPEPGTWWALSDNGFGNQANSPDWRLCLYLFAVAPRTADDDRNADRALGPTSSSAVSGVKSDSQIGRVELRRRIALSDPAGHFPFRLTHEFTPGRPLTGGDVDPESFVAMPDGTFWISDEFGPWLLHVDGEGRLLAPPVAVPDFGPGRDPAKDFVRSPQNPAVLAGVRPANLGASRGFEGLAASPDFRTLYALLEGTVEGDPAGTLRIHEVDAATARFTGRFWRYRLEPAATAIGELATVDATHFVVIERDSKQGEAAAFKRLYEIELAAADAAGVVPKRLVADLLAIADPDHLAGFGPQFRFPYFTIESVQVLDAQNLVVVNDNNFPATGGRGPTVKDATEWLWLHLAAPLR